MQQTQEKDYTQKFDLSLWRKIFHHARQYYPHLAALALSMAISALCDVAFPLLTSYAIDYLIPGTGAQAPSGAMARLMYNMVGSAAALFSGNTMAGFIFLYAMLVIVQVATIYAFLYLGGVIEVGVCYNIRQEAFHKLQELPFSYYDRMPVGYLMSRMTSDIQRLAETIGWSLLDLFWGVVMLVMCSVTMLTINWKLGLAVMVVLPPLAVISFYFQQKILKSWRAVRKTNSRITGAFNEGIMGAKTTKTLVREEANMQEFGELTHEMRRSSVRAASLNALYLPYFPGLAGHSLRPLARRKPGAGWSHVPGRYSGVRQLHGAVFRARAQHCRRVQRNAVGTGRGRARDDAAGHPARHCGQPRGGSAVWR